jgi:hypothetical protein
VGRVAQAVEMTDAIRSFKNFTRDAATVEEGRLRLEVQGMKIQDEQKTRLNLIGFRIRADEISAGALSLLGSYGLSKNSELGFVLPGYIETRTVSGNKTTREDMGDVTLYGKFTRNVNDSLRWAAGLELRVPSGSKAKEFGTDEVGFNPFVSGRFVHKAFGMGAHVGYEMTTGDVPDVFNWSFELFLRGSSFYTIRHELTGRVFHQGGFRNVDLTLWPGVDLHFSDNFTIRPTGMVGGTDIALDYGIGLGLAYVF